MVFARSNSLTVLRHCRGVTKSTVRRPVVVSHISKNGILQFKDSPPRPLSARVLASTLHASAPRRSLYRVLRLLEANS